MADENLGEIGKTRDVPIDRDTIRAVLDGTSIPPLTFGDYVACFTAAANKDPVSFVFFVLTFLIFAYAVFTALFVALGFENPPSLGSVAVTANTAFALTLLPSLVAYVRKL
jgi:hypothetical protein